MTSTVASRESITLPRLTTKLLESRGNKFVTLKTRTPVQMNKTDNPFHGRVEKISDINGMIGFKFQNSVNAQLARDGEDADFVAGPRKWGERREGTPLVEHKGAFYLEVKVEHAGQPTYLLDSEPITPEQFAELEDFLPPPKNETVVLRDYKLDRIIQLNMDGHQYSVVK